MGCGKGTCPLEFEKNVVFLVTSGKKQISPLLAPPYKNFGKIHCWPPPGKNRSDAHGPTYIFKRKIRA